MQKHKSKYKQPKDFEKSQKPHPRKDLKDYTLDDKKGKLNPYSTEEKQHNVLRKTDKKYEESENLIPKDKSHYYKLNGEHDPKYTAKKRKEYQDAEESDLIDVEKIKRSLTREQKEYFIQEYIRRRVKKRLQEQAEEPAPEPAAAQPEPAAEPKPAAEPAAEPADNTNTISAELSSTKSIVDAARLITSGISGYIESLPEETRTTAKNKFLQLVQKYINTQRVSVQQ